MTPPQQDTDKLPDSEPLRSTDRRASRPITFHDDEALLRRLERRSTDRRRRQRRGAPASTTGPDLGARELCHDLRQPLASAVLLAHLIGKEDDLTTAGRQRLEQLHTELGRLAGMLASQLEAVTPVLVDLSAVARDVCDAQAPPAAAPVRLDVGTAPLVLGDPVQLARLLANLVTNARRAAGPTGTVHVEVDQADGAARVTVEDTGGAVGDKLVPGFGLGLMIVDSVVRRHGGTSTCTASPLGGLRVSVIIPAAMPAQVVGGAE